MILESRFSQWVLRVDGFFLGLAGSTAMLSELAGHFFGIGPLAATLGSPHTIGGFEAHGLAVLIAVLLVRASHTADRTQWHVMGFGTHLFLGTANILFWVSFVQHGVVPVGIATTILHGVFVVAQTICMWRAASNNPLARSQRVAVVDP